MASRTLTTTVTEPSRYTLTLQMRSPEKFISGLDERLDQLSSILFAFKQASWNDRLSQQITDWGRKVVQIGLPETADRETVDKIKEYAKEAISVLDQTCSNPFDGSPLVEPVIASDGIWDKWTLEEYKKLNTQKSPFNDEPLEIKKNHTFAQIARAWTIEAQSFMDQSSDQNGIYQQLLDQAVQNKEFSTNEEAPTFEKVIQLWAAKDHPFHVKMDNSLPETPFRKVVMSQECPNDLKLGLYLVSAQRILANEAQEAFQEEIKEGSESWQRADEIIAKRSAEHLERATARAAEAESKIKESIENARQANQRTDELRAQQIQDVANANKELRVDLEKERANGLKMRAELNALQAAYLQRLKEMSKKRKGCIIA